MSKRILVVVALALGLVLAWLLLANQNSPPSPIATPAQSTMPTMPAIPVLKHESGTVSSDSAPPPWAANGTPQAVPQAPPTPAMPASTMAVPGTPDLQALKKMQKELTDSLREGKQVDPKKVIESLDALKQKYGPTVAGVNLEAVINNMNVSQEMQALALKIQHETTKPGGPDQKALQAYLGQLQSLQSQLRMDISVPPQPLPITK